MSGGNNSSEKFTFTFGHPLLARRWLRRYRESLFTSTLASSISMLVRRRVGQRRRCSVPYGHHLLIYVHLLESRPKGRVTDIADAATQHECYPEFAVIQL